MDGIYKINGGIIGYYLFDKDYVSIGKFLCDNPNIDFISKNEIRLDGKIIKNKNGIRYFQPIIEVE